MTRPDRARRVRRHAIVPADPSHAVPSLDRLEARQRRLTSVVEADYLRPTDHGPAPDRPRELGRPPSCVPRTGGRSDSAE